MRREWQWKAGVVHPAVTWRAGGSEAYKPGTVQAQTHFEMENVEGPCLNYWTVVSQHCA